MTTRTMWNGGSGSILAPLVERREWQHPSPPCGMAGVAAAEAPSLWNDGSGSILAPLVEWREWQQHAATPAIPQKHHCEERSDEESEIRQHISRTVTASKGLHLY